MDPLRRYRQVWAADFEFSAPLGGRPEPLCVVARELRTGRLERLWLGDGRPALPPYPTGPDVLFVAYYASAELGCHIALNWPVPQRILDLYAEFRNRTNGLPTPCGSGLLGALAYYGLGGAGAEEKQSMRELALRGGPYTAEERAALLDYCQSDVDALARLLPAMRSEIDFPRALLRGRYMAAAARMEWDGVPIDTGALRRLLANWDAVKHRLIEAVDADYGVFVPASRRPIDPTSRLGAEILRTAREWDIDPHELAEAVEYVWQEENAPGVARREALRAARKATGLNASAIARWEESGRDHSTFPGLDVTARTLADELPELGIGPGYDPDAPDETDHAGRLWEVLRRPAEPPKPKHHPDVLNRAAELVTSGVGESCRGLLSFSSERFEQYLIREGIPWPRLASGKLALDDDTFREMARAYPARIGPLRDLRNALGQLRLNELAVGPDGRNRTILSAFRSKTGRNQPSNSRFIFGPSAWLRGLIRPGPGRAVAYVDWEQQEFGIAAALSPDPGMMEAYVSGDPYLTFAKQAGAVPADATKASHKAEREQFKVCALAVLYGMGPEGLARKLGVPAWRGRELLRLHQQTYPRYWRWSQAVQDMAMLTGRLRSAFGWTLRVGRDTKTTTLRNFPMQANGAEMLRLACCLATERDIRVCAPVHDALLIEADAGAIEADVGLAQEAMREASELVLPEFPLRTDAKIVRYPDRYMDDRGVGMWETVWGLIGDEGAGEEPVADCAGYPSHRASGSSSDPPDPVQSFFLPEGSISL